MFRIYDMVRIDHFRGLVQFWEVPASEDTAENGSWQDVPTYDFFDRLMSEFPGFPVIAEDLGIITDDVKEAKEHYGFPGMKILMFAFGEDTPLNPYQPHNFERNCIVYTGTHDNNTLQGWIKKEAKEEDAERLYNYIGEKYEGSKLNWRLIRLAMMSIADAVIIPAQDILGLGEKARMNQPANTFGNWKWRLKAGQLKKRYGMRMKKMTEIYARA
jgi:4-alpha-glucanotransferase